MKKILGLSVAAMMIMALVGGGTWAYFSDTEITTGNTFAAGTVDLQVGASDPTVEVINIGGTTGIKPTDGAVAADWTCVAPSPSEVRDPTWSQRPQPSRRREKRVQREDRGLASRENSS